MCVSMVQCKRFYGSAWGGPAFRPVFRRLRAQDDTPRPFGYAAKFAQAAKILARTIQKLQSQKHLRKAPKVRRCMDNRPALEPHCVRRLPAARPRWTQMVQTWRGDNTCHCSHDLYVESKFAKRAISVANLPSLQACSAVTTLRGISRAPTSVVRVRAQKNARSRAQGNVASSEKSPTFSDKLPALSTAKPAAIYDFSWTSFPPSASLWPRSWSTRAARH